MSQRFRGAVIKATPPSPTSSAASAIWTLQQQAQFSSTWPAQPAPGPSPGGLWSWGGNQNGQLGLNIRYSYQRSSPNAVGALTTWQYISGACAIKSDGTLWTWGWNPVGDGSSEKRSSPVQIGALTNWSKVSRYSNGAFGAIKTDGTLWTWGRGAAGRTGQNNVSDLLSPVQLGSGTWSSVKAGFSGTNAIKSDGTLWGWGSNSYAGNLGQNDRVDRSSPVQIGSDTWSYTSQPSYFFVGVKTNGTLWACGTNVRGGLGQNDTVFRSSPVQVGALTNWSKCFSATNQNNTVFAIKTDGTLWSWGGGNYGSTAQNNTIDRSSPVQVGTGLWTKAALGYATTLLLKSDNTIWMTGRNHQGQLGQGNNINQSSPVQVGALTTWQNIGVASNIAVMATKT